MARVSASIVVLPRALADAEDDPRGAGALQVPWIDQAGQVVERRVEVDVVVGVLADEAPRLVDARHRDQAVEQVRVAGRRSWPRGSAPIEQPVAQTVARPDSPRTNGRSSSTR